MLALVSLAVAILSAQSALADCVQYSISDTFDNGAPNPNFWFLADGTTANLAANPDGGLATSINSERTNQVLMSTLRWQPGTTAKVVAKASDAVGVISTFCFYDGAAGHDEIDLELVGNAPAQLMMPIWKGDGKDSANRVGLIDPPNKGDWISYADFATGASMEWNNQTRGWAPTAAYSLAEAGFSQSGDYHTYEFSWDASVISWTVDGQLASKYTRGPSAAWPEEALPANLGIWTMVDPNFAAWAGAIDFNANPKPTYRIKSVEISGCAIPNEKAPAGVVINPVGAPAPSSSASSSSPPAPASSGSATDGASSGSSTSTTTISTTSVGTLTTIADPTSTVDLPAQGGLGPAPTDIPSTGAGSHAGEQGNKDEAGSSEDDDANTSVIQPGGEADSGATGLVPIVRPTASASASSGVPSSTPTSVLPPNSGAGSLHLSVAALLPAALSALLFV